jgi:predicted DNA-binding transcriptional regulator AlpA
MTTTETLDLVGLTEIAERTSRSRTSVHNLVTRREDFPAPIARLAMGPVWLWEDVLPFFPSLQEEQS